MWAKKNDGSGLEDVRGSSRNTFRDTAFDLGPSFGVLPLVMRRDNISGGG